jgi:hypothetical protein
MKKQDKFEEYLRKEMGSIQYDGEDRMWEGFKGQVPIATPLEQIISWSIPLAVIGMVGLGIFLYSGSQTADSTLTGKNEGTPSEEVEGFETDQMESNPKLAEITKTNEVIQSHSENVIREESNVAKINKVTNSQLKVKENTKGKYSSEARATKDNSDSSSEWNGIDNLETVANSQERNDEGVETPQLSNQSRVEPQTSKQSTSLQTKKSQSIQTSGTVSVFDETKSELASQDQLSKLDFLPAKESLLFLDNDKDLLNLQPSKLDRKRISNWSGFLGAAAGPQAYQLYTAGLNYSRPMSRRFDINISLGLQSELGNIVSQDSFIKEIGVAIIETRIDKDLNDLTSVFVSAVPLLRVGQFEIGIGPRLSYGVHNRFRIVTSEATANLSGLNSYGFPIPQESFISQDWSSLNRLRVGGDLVLRYQSRSRFGMEVHLTKNFNELIKENLAVSDRSNSPLTVGLQLNYIIKN